jgi:DNA repair protein SbcC/Rad50
MIPIKLTLRNFLSYGENGVPLDFTGLRVACLSGCNGGGKSAILDAITWSLWGQARTQSADDLVRLGQSSMLVEFEFGFDGAEYRVVRKRTRGRTGQSDLQFQLKGADGSYRALTEQGVRATQERIGQILRMDYDTFVNSAFLLQGRADEFARKSAAERKRILAEILNLRVYDELVEAARAKAREAEAARDVLEMEIARAEAEVAREAEYEAEIAACQAELESIRGRLDETTGAHRELLARKAELDAREQRYRDLSRRLELAERETAGLRSQLAQAVQKTETARALLARAEEIRGNFERLQFARKRLHDLGTATQTLRRLETERAQVEQELLKARGEIITRLKLLCNERQQLEAKEKHLPSLQAQIRDLTAEARVLEEIAERQRKAQEDLQDAIRRQAEAAAKRGQLANELEKAQERFALLKEATVRCPVCCEELSPEKRNDLGHQLRAEIKELETGLKTAATAVDQEDGQITLLRRQIERDSRKLQTGRLITDHLAQAQQTENQILEALKELPICRDQITRLEAELEANEFGGALRQRLKVIDTEIAALGYSEEEHAAAQEEVANLALYEREQLNLEAAQAGLAADEQQVGSLQEMIALREQSVAEDHAERAWLETELKEREALLERLGLLEREIECLRSDQSRATHDLGAASDQRERCQRLREELKERRAARDQVGKDKSAFDELAKAFGRNGIQALIIENAIPEIEQEANRILTRMSDNGMRVSFRTQRDTKTAGVAETLEIDISDSAGTRKYELYSGGEAFRANFAIRVALSKLLARRAGARLQTLVIDEGFGSQDVEGRDRLIEAIDSIRDDFEKILVVTHLDELKEFFPSRIEVFKGEGGSQAVVLS